MKRRKRKAKTSAARAGLIFGLAFSVVVLIGTILIWEYGRWEASKSEGAPVVNREAFFGELIPEIQKDGGAAEAVQEPHKNQEGEEIHAGQEREEIREGQGQLSGVSQTSGEGQRLDGVQSILTEKEKSETGSLASPSEEKQAGRYAKELQDEDYRKANNIYAVETAVPGEITLGFGGDILFDPNYSIMVSMLSRGKGVEGAFSEGVLTQMRSADLMMVNNEFTYTNRGTPIPEKAYTFRAKPESVQYLHDMGVDLVSLANNHAFDYGEESLLDTLDTLESAGIPSVGAGRNLEEASAPVYMIAGDIKIAIVSATQIERLEHPDTRGATEELPGVFRCWDPAKLLETVKKAKENSDFVIVYIHWGTENVTEPDTWQLGQAPKLAEAGADLIIGDHPHCLQPIALEGRVPVIYSLGNFWFNSRELDTCMVKAVVDENGLKSLQFLPALQKNCFTSFLDGEEKHRVLEFMRSISPGIRIDGEGYIALPQ